MIQLSSVLAQETPLLFLCPCNRLRGSKHFVLFTFPHHRSFLLIPLASLWSFSGFVPTSLGLCCSKVPQTAQCNAAALQGRVTLESTQPGRHMDQLSSSFARHQAAHQLTQFDSLSLWDHSEHKLLLPLCSAQHEIWRFSLFQSRSSIIFELHSANYHLFYESLFTMLIFSA